MTQHSAEPVREVKFFTPGVFVLLLIIAVGAAFGAYRFVFGIGSVTNLDNQWPWGIWIGIDVATGVALAAGGFTTGALVYIFNRQHYHGVVRAALLTAMLGYTFVGIGLMFDLGKYYNIWRPVIHWQGNSVLFEVGICVVCYLTVLYIEFAPIVLERFRKEEFKNFPLNILNPILRIKGVQSLVGFLERILDKVMFLFIIMGVVLSCMHQSSLGGLMIIAATKMHPLWFTPISPLLFLSSAIAVGFPMVIFESMVASKSFKRPFEMEVLTPLSQMIPFLLGIYMALKIGDMAIRDTYVYLVDGSVESIMFLIEMGVGVILPLVMLLSDKVRESPKLLFASACLIVGGVALNRVNVFLVAYTPPYAEQTYFPAIGEFAVTAALICTLVLVYRFVALNFPVLDAPHSQD